MKNNEQITNPNEINKKSVEERLKIVEAQNKLLKEVVTYIRDIVQEYVDKQ